MLNHFRNLLIFQVSQGDLNLLEVSEAEIAALKEQNTLASTESLTRILEVLSDAELRLRDTASKKILLEVTALKAIEARNAVSLDAVLKQLNQLRGSGTGVQPATTAAQSPTAAPAARPVPKPALPIKLPRRAARRAWQKHRPSPPIFRFCGRKLIESVGRVSPFTRSYLVDANPVSFVKNVLVIGFDPEFEDHLGLVDNARNHSLLQTKLAELGHANCQIKFIKAEAPVGRVVQSQCRRQPRRHRSLQQHSPVTANATAQTPLPQRQGEKIRARSVQQGHFQGRSADSKGTGDFQRHDCGSAGLISIQPFNHSTINKFMSSIGKLMKQAARMQQQMEQTQAQLAARTVEATSGGGAVKVVAKCDGSIASIKIDPAAFNPADAQLLEDMILTAANQALGQAKEISNTEMGKITAGLSLPGM